MFDYILGPHNLVHRTNRTAYTKQELNDLFNLSTSAFNKFMKKMLNHNVIGYLVTSQNKVKKTFVMVNPNVARRRKAFDPGCTSVFKKLKLSDEDNN